MNKEDPVKDNTTGCFLIPQQHQQPTGSSKHTGNSVLNIKNTHGGLDKETGQQFDSVDIKV